jgi:hypothetical protein
LENILAYDTSQCGVCYFFDELSNFSCIVSEFIDKFVGVDCTIVNNGLDAHRYIVLSDNLLGSQAKDRSFHIYFYDIFADWIDDVYSWFNNLKVTTKRLMDSYAGCCDLIDRTLTAATYTRTPYTQAAYDISTTL